MPIMNFDLEDGLPPVSFSINGEGAERMMNFMAECQQDRDAHAMQSTEIAELRAKVESLAADAERLDFMTRMGFTNAGRYSGMVQVIWMDDILDRHLTNGKDIRDALDKCIAMAKEKAK